MTPKTCTTAASSPAPTTTRACDRQAALAYQEIVNRVPEDIATRRRMGILFSELPGFQSRAVLQLKQVLEKNPRDAEVLRRLGEMYLQSRNFAEAEKYIRQTLEFNPRDAQAHQNLATILVGQNRFEDAVDKYKQALALDPKLYRGAAEPGQGAAGAEPPRGGRARVAHLPGRQAARRGGPAAVGRRAARPGAARRGDAASMRPSPR